jgi:hypothetical protein
MDSCGLNYNGIWDLYCSSINGAFLSARIFLRRIRRRTKPGLSPGEDDNAVMHGKDRREGVNSMEEQY